VQKDRFDEEGGENYLSMREGEAGGNVAAN
jgi:hypothetical protein